MYPHDHFPPRLADAEIMLEFHRIRVMFEDLLVRHLGCAVIVFGFEEVFDEPGQETPACFFIRPDARSLEPVLTRYRVFDVHIHRATRPTEEIVKLFFSREDDKRNQAILQRREQMEQLLLSTEKKGAVHDLITQ